MTTSQNQINEVCYLYSIGLKVSKIARAEGLSEPTVRNILKNYYVPTDVLNKDYLLYSKQKELMDENSRRKHLVNKLTHERDQAINQNQELERTIDRQRHEISSLIHDKQEFQDSLTQKDQELIRIKQETQKHIDDLRDVSKQRNQTKEQNDRLTRDNNKLNDQLTQKNQEQQKLSYELAQATQELDRSKKLNAKQAQLITEMSQNIQEIKEQQKTPWVEYLLSGLAGAGLGIIGYKTYLEFKSTSTPFLRVQPQQNKGYHTQSNPKKIEIPPRKFIPLFQYRNGLYIYLFHMQ